MKKYLAVLAIAVLGFTVSCSKGSPEAEAKIMMNSVIKLTEASAEKLEKAAAPKDAADALLAYATEMKVLAEKGKDFEKKYPDMKLTADEKFKAENEAITKVMKRFIEASIKASTKFASSKEYMDAVAKMQEIMK